MQSAGTTYDWPGGRGDKWRRHLDPMEAMLSVVDTPLLAALRLGTRVDVADIGCGGGHTSCTIAREAPAGSVVHGYDVNEGLVDSARARAGQRGLTVDFRVADTEHFRPARAYQRLTSRFGIMFFRDPPAAFANLRRWLTPDGRFAFAVWGAARDNPWVGLVREVVGQVVALPEAPPDSPGPFRYGEQGALAGVLHQAGFVDVETRPWTDALAVGGGLDAAASAEFCLAAYSTLAEALSHAGRPAYDQARSMLTRRLTEHERDGVVSLPCRVLIVTGTRGA